MTDNGTLQQLEAERSAAYGKRTTQYTLRGAVLDAAEAAGADPSEPLPEPLAKAYGSYSREIARLNEEIAGLDQRIAIARRER